MFLIGKLFVFLRELLTPLLTNVGILFTLGIIFLMKDDNYLN
jgi:hypothetical protein